MSEKSITELMWDDNLVEVLWSYYSEQRHDTYFTYQNGDAILEKTQHVLFKNANVCDYGCGAGYLLEKLCQKYPCSGYDYTKKSLLLARARVGEHKNLEQLSVINEETMSHSRQHDVLYFVETIEHLLDHHVTPTLKNIRQLLKTGGIVIVTTPNQEKLKENTVFCPKCEHSFHPWQHVRSFSAQSLTSFMRRFGFEEVSVFTTDFAAKTPLQRLKAKLRPWLGRNNPHLVYIGKKI